jgi:hypothetical protein
MIKVDLVEAPWSLLRASASTRLRRIHKMGGFMRTYIIILTLPVSLFILLDAPDMRLLSLNTYVQFAGCRLPNQSMISLDGISDECTKKVVMSTFPGELKMLSGAQSPRRDSPFHVIT